MFTHRLLYMSTKLRYIKINSMTRFFLSSLEIIFILYHYRKINETTLS